MADCRDKSRRRPNCGRSVPRAGTHRPQFAPPGDEADAPESLRTVTGGQAPTGARTLRELARGLGRFTHSSPPRGARSPHVRCAWLAAVSRGSRSRPTQRSLVGAGQLEFDRRSRGGPSPDQRFDLELAVRLGIGTVGVHLSLELVGRSRQSGRADHAGAVLEPVHGFRELGAIAATERRVDAFDLSWSCGSCCCTVPNRLSISAAASTARSCTRVSTSAFDFACVFVSSIANTASNENDKSADHQDDRRASAFHGIHPFSGFHSR
jgi:hypothetical protein